MEDHRGQVLLILAGYPDEMEWFLTQNPGLRSRFPLVISFPDYSVEELLAIGEQMWQQRQYELAPEARLYLKLLVSGPRWAGSGEGGNARAIRNLVERSLRCQALRLMGRPNPTREELMAISRADLEQALDEESRRPW
jgi:stage V sporulation protein K